MLFYNKRIEEIGLWRIEKGLRIMRERGKGGYDNPNTRVMITLSPNKGWVTR